MNIEGHSAVVTGGGSGMGAETARRLAAAGARVAVLDLDDTAAGTVAAEVGGLGIACDVSDASAVENAVARAGEVHGAARICVNCAGIATAQRIVGRNGPAPLDGFRRVIEVNLVGTFNVMRVCAADMTGLEPVNDTGERGVMIATASVAAFEGQIGQAAYAASKGGLVGMTLPVARDLASLGIRVMTIAPSLFATGLTAGIPDDRSLALTQDAAFPKRMGRPEEYARMAIAIYETAMMNGSTIRVDSGQRFAPR
jgi:NAD(P)-dependent dehydrogenase (short-subunit alcohol dehydrogenase family)